MKSTRLNNGDSDTDKGIIGISDEEFLRIAVIPPEERGDSFNHSFHPEMFDSIFVDDGFKNFNAFMKQIFESPP